MEVSRGITPTTAKYLETTAIIAHCYNRTVKKTASKRTLQHHNKPMFPNTWHLTFRHMSHCHFRKKLFCSRKVCCVWKLVSVIMLANLQLGRNDIQGVLIASKSPLKSMSRKTGQWFDFTVTDSSGNSMRGVSFEGAVSNLLDVGETYDLTNFVMQNNK